MTTVFFDGICNLCNSSVQFIIAHDPKGQFRFAALQSDVAKEMLKTHKVDTNTLDTIILLEGDKVYTKSSAALRIARKLTGLWPALYAFYVIPKFIRDPFYNLISRNRYKIWGKQESCWVPTPELKERFL